MRYADLSHADVRGADLSRANLSSANLHEVDDERADFTAAILLGVKRTDEARRRAEGWAPPES